VVTSPGAVGGGILAFDTLSITNVVLTGNRAVQGGAISGGTGSRLVLSHVTISGNEAVFAAGLRAAGDLPRMRNVTISGNLADEVGGVSVSTSGTLEHVTIVNNRATTEGSPGGLLVSDPTTLRNTLIAGNLTGTGDTLNDCAIAGPAEQLVSLGSNLVTAPGFTCTGLLASDVTGVNPLLGPLAANGGSTSTHALLPGSPAIDAGDGGCAPVDQRGVLRPQGRRCDIGAFEAGAGSAGAFPDFDGDGRADLLVAPGNGSLAQVVMFSGATGDPLNFVSPFIQPTGAFDGTIGAAACDFTGDGPPDVVAAAHGPNGPEIVLFPFQPGPMSPSDTLVPFGPLPLPPGRASALGAPSVACADVDGDGVPDLIAGAPAGAAEGLLIRVFSGVGLGLIREIRAFDGPSRSGVAVGP
jgi:hypothetical protein